MPSADFDIRLIKVNEVNSKIRFNRWDILRYKGEPINVNFQASIDPFINDNKLVLTLGVFYIGTVESRSITYLKYFISLEYDIPNILEHIEVNDYSILLPPYMLTIMMSVGIGTLRGMLVKCLSNTKLKSYPLPILNITEIIHSLHLSHIPHKSSSPLFHCFYE